MSRGDDAARICTTMTIAREQNARLSTMKTLLYHFPKITGGFADEHLLSPSLSSTLSGGEGARRAGEEALLTVCTDSHREMVLQGRHMPLFPSAPLLLFLLATLLAPPLRAADEVTTALQQGLFEEEANQNLDAAIKAYQSVLERHDEQRKLASTALFRLGECYRKLGRTNDAVAQYQRLLRDYSDQTTLVTITRQNLAGLSPRMAETTSISIAAKTSAPLDPRQRSLFLEGIKLAERQLAEAKEKTRVGVIPPISQARYEREVLRLKRELALADEGPASAEARKLLDEEVKLQEKVVEEVQARLRNGKAMLGEEIDAQRELLALKREQVSLESAMTALPMLPLQQTFDQRLKSSITDAAATNEEDNEVRSIQALIKDSPDLINAITGRNVGNQLETPLMTASRKGQLVVARFLLDNGANVNLKGGNGNTPLHTAAQAGHKGMVEMLLARGADVNASYVNQLETDQGQHSLQTPMLLAARAGFKSVVEVLLANKADPNAKDQFGGTPLHQAAAKGLKQIAETLLAGGANVNALRLSHPPNQYDSPDVLSAFGTPLHLAVQQKDRAMVELLLAKGADVSLRNHLGETPLSLAARHGDTNLVALLLAAKADVNASPDSGSFQGWTALHHAVNKVRGDAAELLLKSGANPNARLGVAWPDRRNGESGFTPLLIASYKVQPHLGLLLLDSKADPKLKSSIGNAPLHTALYPVFLGAARSREYITALLDRGAEVQALNASGFSPLSQAAWTGQREIVQLLLDRGADPNQRDRGEVNKDRSQTPLTGLMGFNPKDAAPVVETLLLARADPNLKSELGYTALHRAIQFNQPAKIIELLATHGANVETTTPDGETPLTLAANANEPKEILLVLLKAGANPNMRGQFGFTALFKAVLRGNLGAIEVLLAAGANPNLANEQGVTPLDIAKDWLKTPRPVGPIPAPVIQTQMVETLRKAGASEWAPRPNQITVFRRSTGAIEIPFLKDKDGRNRFSLFEVIATIGFSSSTRFPFPDLTNAIITRLVADTGALTNIPLNIAARVASGDCQQNLWLEWGDLIEIPELEHKLSDRWNGQAHQAYQDARRQHPELHPDQLRRGQLYCACADRIRPHGLSPV